MRVPPQFADIFAFFHQDFDIYPSFENGVEHIVKIFNLKNNPAAKAYFDDLINGDYTSGELQSLWTHSQAGIYFQNDNQVRNVLRLIRSKMDE